MTADTANHNNGSIYRHILRGSAWVVAMRWTIRGIGVVSVAILARLLTPDDFGVLAMATIAAALIEEFFQFGSDMLLIREPDATREHCDSAWTIRIIQGLVIAIILVVSAPLIAAFFNEPRVVNIVYVLALVALLTGFENIGMVLVQKELDFARDFRFNVYKRISKFFFTIGLALALLNYWALALGQLAAVVTGVVISYFMHSYRPRFSLARGGAYLRFSLSMIPLNVGRLLNSKSDVLAVGRIANTADLGAYNVAAQLSELVTREVVVPLGRALLPNYAKIAHDPRALAEALAHVLSGVAIICLPLGAGLWVTAKEFVLIILGGQWTSAIAFIKWLAIYGTLSSIIHVLTVQILIAAGHEKRSAVMMWVRLAILIPCIVGGAIIGGVGWIAPAATLAAAVALPIAIGMLVRCIPITFGQIAKAFWRPCVSTLMMLAVVYWVQTGPSPGVWLTFGRDVIVGALTYAVVLSALWYAAGRPRGVESLLWDTVSRRVSRDRHVASGER